MGAPGVAGRARRFRGRQFRSRGSGLPRRRLHLACGQRRAADQATAPVPPGTPRWGSAWKKATREMVQPLLPASPRTASNYAQPQQLSRSRSDLQGRDRPAAGAHDLQLHRERLQDVGVSQPTKAAEIARAAECQDRRRPRSRAAAITTSCPDQSSHNTGGTIMGTDPKTSVVNRYLQCLGREQSVRHGRRRLPAECRPTIRPDRSARWPIGRRRQSRRNI